MEDVMIKSAHTKNFTMDYIQFGTGSRPLVILPGLSVEKITKYADVIADSYKLFASDFTVYVFDRRKELPSYFTVIDMAEDTALAIESMGLSKISLAGMSQGGMMAMTIAANNPDMVGKLILSSTSSCIKSAQYKTIEKWIEVAKTGDTAALFWQAVCIILISAISLKILHVLSW